MFYFYLFADFLENAFTIVPLVSEGIKFLLFESPVDLVHKMSNKVVTVSENPGVGYFKLSNGPREGAFRIVSNSKKKSNDRVCPLINSLYLPISFFFSYFFFFNFILLIG